MLGYIVYGYQVLENDIKDTDVIKFIESDEEYISTGCYLHKLYRDKKNAFEELKRQYLEQKESLENKLKDIDLKLKEIEDDN